MKKLISFLLSLAFLVGIAGFQIAQAQNDFDTLVRAFQNTYSGDFKSVTSMKISTDIDGDSFSINLQERERKYKDTTSGSLHASVNVTEGDETLTASGGLDIVSDLKKQVSFLKLSGLNIEGNFDEMQNAQNIVKALRENIKGTYVRFSVADMLEVIDPQLQELEEEMGTELAFSGEKLMSFGTEIMEIVGATAFDLKKKGNSYNISLKRSLSEDEITTLAEKVSESFTKYHPESDIEIPAGDELELLRSQLNEMLGEISRNVKITLKVDIADEKIKRISVRAVSKNAEMPFVASMNARFSYGTSKKISMPRCYVDMIDAMDILQTIDPDMDEENAPEDIKMIADQIKELKTCE